MLLNREKHRLVMNMVLRDIADDPILAPSLGFKGGTCAYFFYGLPRFSVDLDFDFLGADVSETEEVLSRLQGIAKRYGTVRDAYVKRNTIFVLLSYGDRDHNIKIEVNRDTTEETRSKYVLRQYIGLSLLVARQDYMFAMKLAALLTRKHLVMRDVFDIHFFASKQWDIDTEALERRVKQTPEAYIGECIKTVESLKENQLLTGIGELIDEKQKAWVKEHLIPDAVFLLRNYQSALSMRSSDMVRISNG